MEQLCERMEGRPAAFIRSFSDRDISNLEGFKHRTFQTQDAIALSMALREALEEFGSMERLFASTDCQSTENIGPAIERAMGYLLAVEGVPARMRKHLPRPSTGSACKRVCLYLRWMVRQGPVDLGIWKTFDPTWLVLPLDVHSARQARHFGMLERAQTDWKAALELTEKCRQLDPRDPCRYDYAFFGVGVSGNGSTNVSA